ncbi:MAG TPA: ECF transporter S component [Candidatus Limnocylindria bacterium]|nr:ECF transporter S component [Candidatus Limnocylindria bacterium]
MRGFWDFRGGFTSMAIVLIPITIAINTGLHFITVALNLPIYLDTIGTILAAILAGPWVAAVVGLLTNVVIGLVTTPTAIPYGLTNAAIGITAGALVYFGLYRHIWGAAVAGLVLPLVGATISAPITVVVFGGASGTGSDAVTAFFLATGDTLVGAVLKAGFLVALIDKMISSIFAYLVAKNIPSTYMAKFPGVTRDRKPAVA